MNGRSGCTSCSILIRSIASSAIAVIRFQPGRPSCGKIGVVLRNSMPGVHWLLSSPRKP